MAVETIRGACGHKYDKELKADSDEELERSIKYWQQRDCSFCYKQKRHLLINETEIALSLPTLQGVSQLQVEFARSVRCEKIKEFLDDYGVQVTLDSLVDSIRTRQPGTQVFLYNSARYWLDNKEHSLNTLMREAVTPPREKMAIG